MKITVLAVEQSAGHADGRRSGRVASLLRDIDGVEVELLSVYGADPVGEPGHRALVRRTTTGDEPTRAHHLGPEVMASAAATSSTRLPNHHVLVESELRLALRSLDADVLILTDPTIADFCRQALDISVGLALVVDDPSVSLTHLGAADALMLPGPESARAVTEALGEHGPAVHVVPPHAWQHGVEEAESQVIAVVSSAPWLDAVQALVDAFVAQFTSRPQWSLTLTHAGRGAAGLTARALHAGVHGAVSARTREVMETEVLPRATAIVIATDDPGDAMATLLNSVARGVQALVHTDDADVALLAGYAPGARIATDSALEDLSGLEARPTRTIDRPTAEWLQTIRSGAARALHEALTAAIARTADADRLTACAERDLRAHHRASLLRPETAPTPGGARPLEDELLLRCPDLVRWDGTLNEEHDALLEPDVLARNLAFAVTALRAGGVEFVVVSAPTEPGRIAVDVRSAQQAVDAVRAHGTGSLVYTERISSAGRRGSRTLASETLHDEADVGVVAYVPVVSRSRTLRYGPHHGCTIEFAQPSATGDFSVPLGPTRRGKVLSSITSDISTSVGDLDVPTTRELTARRLEDVDFPIDVVWTWVDDTDPAWRSRRDAATGATPVTVNGDDPSRFNNRDELRYSMRSVAMYAPWVRHLYIVTDEQRPSWLTDHPRVTVIDHRDVFSDHDALPTFNSHAIESQLHHIEGLSENFLYFNDDVFLGRRVAPELFFTSTGQTKAFVSPTAIPASPLKPDDLSFYASRKNNRQLIEAAFGRTMVQGYLHTPHALSISVLDEMEHRFAEQWANTQRSRFRSPGDIAVASSLHHAYAQMTDRGVSGALRSRYVKAGATDHQPLMRQILAQRDLDAFCLNDTADRDMDPALQANALRAMLDAYFPMTAPWERR
ncbi:MAG: Exopolysaccharide phosphotransferase [Aeromicrobium sp.]|nr:Exopolysaccharide phosphotransferase [Aeromicrobium sp.]